MAARVSLFWCRDYGNGETNPLPPIDLGEPEAVITRDGRFWYSVEIRQGLTVTPAFYGWSCPGRRWAEWKARRELTRYMRPPPESWTVTP